MTCTLCNATFDPGANIRWVKDGYDIVRCPSCKLISRRELPTRAQLDTIYGVSYFKGLPGSGGTGYLDYVDDEDLHRRAARQRLALLEGIGSRRGRLLDVGAAAGFFVDEARTRGWEALGIDVSRPMVRWGRETLDAPVELGMLSTSTVADGSLDAVTMWDYIEHSIDPVGEIRRVHQLLKPGGVLGLSTGDADAFVARASRSRWHLLTPEHHNFYFTAATLSRLLEDNGFEIVTFDHRGNRYPISYLVHKFRTIVGWQPLEPLTRRLAETRMGSIAVPMNLWDIATVTARRAT